MQRIRFWNGNKSKVRQQHELRVMEELTQLWQRESLQSESWQVEHDSTDLPQAEQEGDVLNGSADALVTVAGNTKFAGQAKITIDVPIANGLLGQRILIVKKERLAEFSAITELADLQRLRIGIPATWVDAGLFRSNGCAVVERGCFDELFERLSRDEFDYVALGANEILDVYQSMVKPADQLVIEPNLMLYYPFPLIFYVASEQLHLAEKIHSGLKTLQGNGRLDACFNDFYGHAVAQLNLQHRRVIRLQNPFLNGTLSHYQSPLLPADSAP
ncbi:hypothetical protein K0504_01035 [Neiella marina]|uniref:Solute-binding protein family 3/N-terminal domain-containing protein n=1 Tax=Neiella holothuriorum TaxID=2870530 RepID=A0ABS7EBA1_9GAMM|nr:hypothetical protein [Neiella holothuriorum]MBW8189604.1 hypothetical protein [Neiella holothuriorum]